MKILLALAAVGLLAGCGGGDHDPVVQPRYADKADYAQAKVLVQQKCHETVHLAYDTLDINGFLGDAVVIKFAAGDHVDMAVYDLGNGPTPKPPSWSAVECRV